MSRYFPGPLWRCGPDPVQPTITDYQTCCFGVGFGLTPDRIQPWEEWKLENSLGYNGNGDNGICNCSQQNYPSSAAAPLCLGDPLKREALIAQFILPQVKQFKQSVSITPPDNPVWCDCPLCHPHPYIDRIMLLANDALRYIPIDYRVCTLAYTDYGLPPKRVRPDRRVVVMITDGNQSSGISTSEILWLWAKKTDVRDLGVYVYASVFSWNRGIWGNMKGGLWGNAWAGNPNGMAADLREWHSRGARHLILECSDDWATNGYGYYLSGQLARYLETDPNTMQLRFIGDCFGQLGSGVAMSAFFRLVTDHPLTGTRDLSESYNCLEAALAEAPASSLLPSDVRSRVRQLALNVRYVELWLKYMQTGAQIDFTDLCTHAIDSNGMVHANAVHYLAKDENGVGIDPNVKFPTGLVPMPYTNEQIDGIIQDGAALPVGPPAQDWPDYSKGVRASVDSTPNAVGADNLFYVPLGTKTIDLWAFAAGAIGNPNGDLAFTFPGPRNIPNYYSVQVPLGLDGRWWRVEYSGLLVLLNIPPYLFPNN